jgi:hypothetical protein
LFRVEELFFVERDGAWAVALRPDLKGAKLAVGMTLVAGLRRWTVSELHPAPAGLEGARLDGAEQLTRGLILRPSTEPMGDAEYKAAAVFLVRVARACRRTVDLEGVLANITSRRVAGAIGEAEARAVAKTAVLVRHLVDHGATGEELDQAAAALDLKEEM